MSFLIWAVSPGLLGFTEELRGQLGEIQSCAVGGTWRTEHGAGEGAARHHGPFEVKMTWISVVELILLFLVLLPQDSDSTALFS